MCFIEHFAVVSQITPGCAVITVIHSDVLLWYPSGFLPRGWTHINRSAAGGTLISSVASPLRSEQQHNMIICRKTHQIQTPVQCCIMIMMIIHVIIVIYTGSDQILQWFYQCVCEVVRWTKYQKHLFMSCNMKYMIIYSFSVHSNTTTFTKSII